MNQLVKDLKSQQYQRIAKLETRIDYVFVNRDLAVKALTHSSFGDGRRAVLDNERLEFLGDRVLGLLTAEALFHFSQESEGTLARRLNALVRKETCAKIAREIALGEALFLSKSEEKQGGRDKTSILGDACEALIAAIYLDGGYGATQKFYHRFWMPVLHGVVKKSVKDPKTLLQEKVMALGPHLPQYKVIERSGPDHAPCFQVEVKVETIGKAQGAGTNKRSAERAAAQAFIQKWETSL